MSMMTMRMCSFTRWSLPETILYRCPLVVLLVVVVWIVGGGVLPEAVRRSSLRGHVHFFTSSSRELLLSLSVWDGMKFQCVCWQKGLETKEGGKKKFRVSVKMWGALSGASACRTEIENVTRRFKKTAFRVCESASVEREMRQYCRER